MITTKETGVQYSELTQAVIDFHLDNASTIAFVTRPLTYTEDTGPADDLAPEMGDTYVDDITSEEVSAGRDAVRKLLYTREADPLFFKYQRGEIDKQVWLDKVAEIKTLWP